MRGETGPVLAEGRRVRLPCQRYVALALPFVDMTYPRSGGATRVEAGLTGDQWEIHRK